MNYIQSLILGLIEGATEYLPISSTFHLIWASKLLGIPQTDFQKAFEVIIQTGAILAVVILYWSLIIHNKALFMKVLVSFVPTAIVGLVLYKTIKQVFFEQYILQLTGFIVVGVIFIIFEKFNKRTPFTKTLSEIRMVDALAIGLVQALAVIPGVSRAGAVILAMMVLGVKRDQAATYSFLLAVPTLLAASALDLYKALPILTTQTENVGLLVTGFVAALLSALVVVRWFIQFLQRHTLERFGWYRIIVGALLLAWLIW